MKGAVLYFVVLYFSLPGCLADKINESLLLTSLNDTWTSNQCGNHPWRTGNDCHCADSLDGLVHCDPSGDAVYIKSQYCMSIDDDIGEEVVGRCLYTYLQFHDPNTTSIGLYYRVPNDVDELEYALCDRLNRRGLLCGKCKDGFGFPMYPDFEKCVKCLPNHYARNWVVYFFISFGPLTLFLMVVVCLRINVASAPLNAFVFIGQVITQPPFTRGFINTINESFIPNGAKVFMRLIFSLYGIWNLDFFVSMIPPFCLPARNIFHILHLTYVIALYPLVVLIVLYSCIELHARGVRVIVWLWRPFYPCCVRFRRHCDIRASVVDAFATFLLLSYVKILFVSFDFFAPSHLMDKNGSTIRLVSYFDASFVLSPEPKIALTVLGISVMLFLFILLPLLLILLYPCVFCQKCLTRCKLHFQLLHFLMNAFNGHYRDGTNGTFDCRSFAAIYLLVRILISVEYITIYFNYHTSVIVTTTALAIAIAVVQPYGKQYAHFNRLDPLTIFFFICWLVSYKDIHRAAGTQLSHQRLLMALSFISLLLPLIFFTALFFKKTLLVKVRKIYGHQSSSCDEQSIEEHTPTPSALQLDYVSGEWLLRSQGENSSF